MSKTWGIGIRRRKAVFLNRPFPRLTTISKEIEIMITADALDSLFDTMRKPEVITAGAYSYIATPEKTQTH